MMKKFLLIITCTIAILPAGCSNQFKLNKYVKLYAMPYSTTKQNVSKDQLPQLHKMLKDKKYAPYWHNIALIIGYISDDPNSVLVLLSFFQRDDSWNLDTDIKLSGKIQNLAYMGYIGGKPADVILRGCIGSNGAEELAKNWIDKIYKTEGPYFQRRENIINRIKYMALIGLAHTGTQDNTAFLTNLYENQHTYCESHKTRTEFFIALADAMAIQEYITINGIEKYKNLQFDLLINNEEMSNLIKKYNKLSWVDNLSPERQ
jgi:hypothetical protein